MTKFFLDANMPYSRKKIFEEIGLEVNHARDNGMAGACDKDIMNFSIKTKSILVTKDKVEVLV